MSKYTFIKIEDGARKDFEIIFGEKTLSEFDKVCQNPNAPNKFKDMQFWIKYYNLAKKQDLKAEEWAKEGIAPYSLNDYYYEDDGFQAEGLLVTDDNIKEDLEQFIKKYRSAKSTIESEIKKICQMPEANEVKKLPDHDGYEVYLIKTPEAAVKYGLVVGGKAGWCISGGYYDGKNHNGSVLEEAKEYFNTYLSSDYNAYYFVYGKGEKYAVCIKHYGGYTIWNKEDNKIDDIPGFTNLKEYFNLDDKIEPEVSENDIYCMAQWLVSDVQEGVVEFISIEIIKEIIRHYNFKVSDYLVQRIKDTIWDMGEIVYDDINEWLESDECLSRFPEKYEEHQKQLQKEKEEKQNNLWKNATFEELFDRRTYRNLSEEKQNEFEQIISEAANAYLASCQEDVLIKISEYIIEKYSFGFGEGTDKIIKGTKEEIENFAKSFYPNIKEEEIKIEWYNIKSNDKHQCLLNEFRECKYAWVKMVNSVIICRVFNDKNDILKNMTVSNTREADEIQGAIIGAGLGAAGVQFYNAMKISFEQKRGE